MSIPPPASHLELEIARFRAMLDARDAAQMVQMANEWAKVEMALEAQIDALAAELFQMRAGGQAVSRSKVLQMERYRSLLNQTRIQMEAYNRWAAGAIQAEQAQMLPAGIESARSAMIATMNDAGAVIMRFDLLPADAVDFMIGMAGDGTPLYELLHQAFPEVASSALDLLVANTAKGINPRQTARNMRDALGMQLQRSMTIARTEQLRAFREAGRQQMAASKIVSGYIRRAALQPRTCAACLALDGTIYPVDEMMAIHPNDRCFMQPVIQGLAPVKAITGKQWFEQQAPSVQQQILGNRYYRAWKQGAYQFEDLATTRHDATWGTTVKVTPLKDLVK